MLDPAWVTASHSRYPGESGCNVEQYVGNGPDAFGSQWPFSRSVMPVETRQQCMARPNGRLSHTECPGKGSCRESSSLEMLLVSLGINVDLAAL